MQSFFRADTLKFIAGASIVITAFAIMLPGVMGFAFSLARLGIVIVLAVLISSALAFLFQFLVKRNKNSSAQPVEDLRSNSQEQENDEGAKQ